MTTRGLAISVVAHGLVVVAALALRRDRPPRPEPIAVRLIVTPPPPRVPPPRPPAPPMLIPAPPAPAPAHLAARVAQPVQPPPHADPTAPLHTAVSLDNGGLGDTPAAGADHAPGGTAGAGTGGGSTRPDPGPHEKVLGRHGDAACADPPTKPKPVERPTEIAYPAEVRAREVEGRLVLRIEVATDGSVTEVAVTSPVDPVLDDAAVQAVKGWRFEPARRCGVAVAGTYTLARRFELGD